MIVELVLRSGSLKDLAAAYGVSYPTIRARLDRLIDRLRAAVERRNPDPMMELLARFIERGEIGPSTAHAIRDLWNQHHPPDRSPPASASPPGR